MKYKAILIGFCWGTLLFLSCSLLIMFGEENSIEWLQFITLAMLIVTPISVGALTLFLIPEPLAEIKTHRKYYALYPVFGWALISLLIQWETLICIIMLLPLYLPLALIGGTIGAKLRIKFNRRHEVKIVCSIVLLPLLMFPIEEPLKASTLRYSVTNSILINAPVKNVWNNLSNIKDIKPEELNWNISHFIGLPKPKSASTKNMIVGGIRDLYWEKGVHFQEKITNIIPNKLLEYDVLIDKESIKIAELDTHITLGDKYFNVESGYYLLSERQGSTFLTLTTEYRMTTKLNWYGKYWANFVLDDFHKSVLNLIKTRNEKEALNLY